MAKWKRKILVAVDLDLSPENQQLLLLQLRALQGDHVQQGLVRLVPKDEQIEWIHNILMWKIHRHICIKFMQIPSTCKIKSRLKYIIMACVITYRELIYKSDLLWMKVSRKVVSTEVTFDDRRTSETWGIEGCMIMINHQVQVLNVKCQWCAFLYQIWIGRSQIKNLIRIWKYLP